MGFLQVWRRWFPRSSNKVKDDGDEKDKIDDTSVINEPDEMQKNPDFGTDEKRKPATLPPDGANYSTQIQTVAVKALKGIGLITIGTAAVTFGVLASFVLAPSKKRK